MALQRTSGVGSLDVRRETQRPGFQRELLAADIDIPIVFITGHGDIRMSVQAMKSGALEFLTIPFRDQQVMAGI